MYVRLPGLDRIDQFYYTSSNVDRRTIQRFYGYTLEDPGRSALRQLDPYLEFGHMLSADRSIDYSARLGEVTVPTLLVAGESDSMSDVPSTELTLAALGSPDKTLMRFGRRDGQVADYGHCDLVWSRYAPSEIFPPLIDWLDHHQPVMPSAQQPRASAQRRARRGTGAVRWTPRKNLINFETGAALPGGIGLVHAIRLGIEPFAELGANSASWSGSEVDASCSRRAILGLASVTVLQSLNCGRRR